jgi:serine/threonine-protein kinase
VYQAFDPELGRRVALKLVEIHGRAPSEALKEARAVAELSHPGVVTVFDVGTEGRHLWLAMELAASDLRHWLRSRRKTTWDDVSRIFLQVAEGLARVHDEGLCHGDIKPDNILIRADGSAAISDFGLAVGAGTSTCRGTPAYMAPEQRRGEPVDARSDQYAFFVTLVEALTAVPSRAAPPGIRPRDLARVITRGLDPRAARRYPDMSAVRDALVRAPRRARRKWTLLAAGSIAVGAWLVNPTSGTACDDLDDVWTPPVRDAVARLDAAALHAPIEERLVTFVDGWNEASAMTCRSDGQPDPCLSAQRLAFETTLETLLEDEHDAVRRGELVSSLDDPKRCLVPTSRPPLPSSRELAQADALASAGEYGESVEVLERILRGHQLDRGQRARAEVSLGRALKTRGAFGRAQSVLEAGYKTSVEAGLDRLASSAAAALVCIHGVDGTRYEHAERWGRHALAHAERDGEPSEERARAQYCMARMARARNRFDEARVHIEDALAIRRTIFGNGHPKVALAAMELGNLEHNIGHHVEAIEQLESACDVLEQAYGTEHPEYGVCLMNLGLSLIAVHRIDDAETVYRRALSIHRKALGEDHYNVAASLANLGEIAKERGHYREAAADYRLALAGLERAFDAEHPRIVATRNDLGIVLGLLGDFEGAIEQYRRALEACRSQDAAVGRQAAVVHLNLGTALEQLEQLDEAEREYRAAIETGTRALGADHPSVAVGHLNLGMLHHTRGRPDLARVSLQTGLVALERSLPPDHPHIQTAREALAAL